MTDPHKYCQERTLKSGSSFYYSFLFLPAEKRKAITAVYAFCREVDDIVDDARDKNIAEIKLKWWSDEIEKVYHGAPNHPVGRALKDIIKKFDLKKHLFNEIIQGMTMDLKYQGYKTFDDLKLYCHCAASTVGLLAAEIFGYKNQKTLEYAKNLGLAFQMTNIIRDVGEDAKRGRIYIPEEDLGNFGVTVDDILKNRIKTKNQNFIKLMKYQEQRARNFYNIAMECLPKEDRKNQRSGIIMASIYLALLDKIAKSNFNVINKRISITPIRKLWLAWKINKNENKLE